MLFFVHATVQRSQGQGQSTTPGGQASIAQLCHLLASGSLCWILRDSQQGPEERALREWHHGLRPGTDAVTFLGPELSHGKQPGEMQCAVCQRREDMEIGEELDNLCREDVYYSGGFPHL